MEMDQTVALLVLMVMVVMVEAQVAVAAPMTLLDPGSTVAAVAAVVAYYPV